LIVGGSSKKQVAATAAVDDEEEFGDYELQKSNSVNDSNIAYPVMFVPVSSGGQATIVPYPVFHQQQL